MSSVNARIKELRKTIGLTQAKFAERIAVSKTYLGEIENHVKNANERVLRLIFSEFEVSEQWLRTGEGEIFREDGDIYAVKAKEIVQSLSTPLQMCALNILEGLAELNDTTSFEIKCDVSKNDSTDNK